jgi:cadmium resistance transport/sequestration family protein
VAYHAASATLRAANTGVAAFAAINVDDIFILMLFFSQVGGEFRNRHVVLGQYLGFATLVALSVLGSLGVLIVSEEWIGLLGLVPIFLGVRAALRTLWGGTEEEERKEPVEGSGVYGVAAVTFANGGDNIGIYVPLFASVGFAQMGTIVVVFFALVAVWCYAGYKLGSHPTVADKIDRYEHVVVPVVLVALGIYIVVESGALSLLVG